MKIKSFSTIILLIYLSLCRVASQSAYIPPAKPKLVIGIVVEQFRYDYIERYWDNFGETGFKRLINEGTLCKNAFYDYFFTQSAPAHATIVTGVNPSGHGIIADNWFDTTEEGLIYCTQDIDLNPVGGSFENGLHSPSKMLTTTFGDELKLSNRGASKVFAIGMKDHSAILSGGHSANASYWYDKVSGAWMSSTYYIDKLPNWVVEFNGRLLPYTYLSGSWKTLHPLEMYKGCQADKNPYELGINGQTRFPYNLSKLSINKSPYSKSTKNFKLLATIPAGNTYTKDFAISLIEKEHLGEDKFTDFLSVNFTVFDNIGHNFGPSSIEMADAILRFDQELGMFLDYVLKKIGKKNVLVYFTSTHGVAEIPELLKDIRIPSGRFSYNQSITLLQSYLKAIYGKGNWLKGYNEKQIYLNRKLIEGKKLELSEVQNKAADFMSKIESISFAVSANTVANNNLGTAYYRRLSNSCYNKRSGDVFINLKPGWIENRNYVTNHNSPYSYDTHVPLIWFGWKVNRSSINRKVNMIDVAPTLSSACEIQTPNASEGLQIIELFE